MKLFHEKLKDAILKNGFSVYKISKLANIERTGLQRCLSGQRLIPEASLLRILDLLCLEERERSHLLKSFTVEQIGTEKFSQREIIQNLTESLTRFCVSEPAPINIEKQVSLSGDFQNGIPVKGRYTVLHMVQSLIEYELCRGGAASADMFLPNDKEFLNRMLPAPGNKKKKPVFRQLIKLFTNESDAGAVSYNLNILDSILPFHLSTGMDYRVYYQYSEFFCENYSGIVLPYYIILNHSVLILLSEDLQNACFFHTPEYVSYYQEYFDKTLESAPLLVHHYENLEQMLNHYKQIKVGTERLYIMEFEPCFFSLMDKTIIEQYLPDYIENRDFLLAMICEHLKQMQSSVSPCCLVSHKGIEYFIKTGNMADVPPGMSISLSAKDRMKLLLRLKEQCLTEESSLRIINPDYFKFPDFVTIRAGYTCGVDFSISDQSGNFRFIYITENTLSKVWADFIENSLNSSMAFSREKTIEILDYYINQLENLSVC